jgi:hypothetical protein
MAEKNGNDTILVVPKKKKEFGSTPKHLTPWMNSPWGNSFFVPEIDKGLTGHKSCGVTLVMQPIDAR